MMKHNYPFCQPRYHFSRLIQPIGPYLATTKACPTWYFLLAFAHLFYFAGGQAEAGEDYEYWNATHQRRPSNQAPHPGPPPQGPMVILGSHHPSSMSTEMMVERPNTLELHGTGGGLGARGTPLRSSLKKNSSYPAVYQNVGPGIINLPS